MIYFREHGDRACGIGDSSAALSGFLFLRDAEQRIQSGNGTEDHTSSGPDHSDHSGRNGDTCNAGAAGGAGLL